MPRVPTPIRPPGFWLPRRLRWLPTAGLILVVIVASCAPSSFSGAGWKSPQAVLVILASIGAIAFRLRAPRVTAVAAVIIAAVGTMVSAPTAPIMIAVLVTLFSAALHTNRRTSIILAAVAAIPLSIVGWAFAVDPWRDVRTVIQIVAPIGFAAAVGDATRSRREFIATITERALVAEATKESEAQRRVAEERLAIARDLHDVMAHQIAVINLNANAAARSLRTRPDDAERSLDTVKQAARTVLGEIGSLLSVLRESDTGRPAEPVPHPVRGLADLDALIETFEESGLAVERRIEGTPIDVPEAVDIVAYRVVQEALTNAHKHGSGRCAHLCIGYRPTTVEITITNDIPSQEGGGAAATARGHGLRGAQERVSSVGGTLTTGVEAGPVYRFAATLPLEQTP